MKLQMTAASERTSLSRLPDPDAPNGYMPTFELYGFVEWDSTYLFLFIREQV